MYRFHMQQQKADVHTIARWLFAALVVWAGIQVLSYLSDVLIPFVLAFLLAYLINPLVCIVQKKIKNRSLAVLTTLIFLAGLGTMVLSLILPMIVEEINHISALLAKFVQNTQLQYRAKEKIPAEIWALARDYLTHEKISSFLQDKDLFNMAQEMAQKVLPGIWRVLSGTANIILGITGLFIIILYLIFLLIDYEKIRNSWQDMLPRKNRHTVVQFIQDFNQQMNRYFRSQALIASLVGVMFAVGFSLLGLPMAIVLGLFIGLLNMVPYLQLIGILPTLLVVVLHCLETGSSFWLVLGGAGAVFAIAQVIQDGFLLPKIMGKSMGLNPAMILLSLSVWGKLLGMLGLLIALPMTCLLLAYYNKFVAGPLPSRTEASGG